MFQKIDFNFPRRVNVRELADSQFAPDFLRNGIREYLNVTHSIVKYYRQWAEVLAEVLVVTGERKVIVLGGGGEVLVKYLRKELLEKFQLDVTFYITDLFPMKIEEEKRMALECDKIFYVEQSINMQCVPDFLKGVRIIPVAFHHLSPVEAMATIADATNKKSAICIFEYTRNSLMGVVGSLLFYFPFNLFVGILLRTRNKLILLFSIVIPVLPFIVAFDGLLSNLRTYNESELMKFTEHITNYNWSMKYQQNFLNPTLLTSFIGLPKDK